MSVLGAVFADYGVFVVVMFSFGIGKIIYDPTFQAYLGDLVPFGRRARVMGISELSWALSLVVAAPVAGVSCWTTAICSPCSFFCPSRWRLGAAALWIFR